MDLELQKWSLINTSAHIVIGQMCCTSLGVCERDIYYFFVVDFLDCLVVVYWLTTYIQSILHLVVCVNSEHKRLHQKMSSLSSICTISLQNLYLKKMSLYLFKLQLLVRLDPLTQALVNKHLSSTVVVISSSLLLQFFCCGMFIFLL